MATVVDYGKRYIISNIAATYYDTTFIDNNLQNNIVHNRDIINVDKYKNFNLLLDATEDITVKDINFLYFTAQRPVELLLSTDDTILLKVSEFYLYQPTDTFSFKITSIPSEDSCLCFVHCMYASLFKTTA